MNGIKESAAKLLTDLRKNVPLVHNITNYVTVNDVANAILAIGGSPIMADDIGETEDITAISSALVINMGTLNERTIASMIASGKKANVLGIPVVFDPVGAGASRLRNETAVKITEQVKISILRGNMSEISFIGGLEASTKGVDASESDSRNDGEALAVKVAQRLGCTVAVTGAVDIISDGKRTVKLYNGHPMLSKVTGTGCMSSGITGAFAGAGKDYLVAAAGAIASMSIAGEDAFEKYGNIGTGSFHMGIIDALSRLDGEAIMKRMKIDEK